MDHRRRWKQTRNKSSNQNSLPDARAEKSKLADLRYRRRNLTAYNQSFSSKLLACTTYIFIDSCKLEDATTQPSGREETVGDSDSCNLSEAMNRRSREIGKTPRERETARSKLKNLPPSRNKKPAKTILIEPPLSRVKAGRPLIEHVRRWRQNRSDDTEAEEEAQTVGKRTGDKKVSSIVFICERCSEGTERRERENFHRFVFTNRNIYLWEN